MEEKARGIVLGGVNFGESDKILKIFTLEKGVVSAKIKGVKKAGAKLKFASEPFCLVEFIFSVSSGRRTIIGASLIDSFYPVREDIEKYFSASVVLEFNKLFLPENILSEEMFLLSINTLKELAYGEKPLKSAVAQFLIFALKISGYALNFASCLDCGCEIKGRIFFNFMSGGFCCEKCFQNNGREINYSTFKALRKIEKGENLTSYDSLPALKLLAFYIANRLEENIKSLNELIKI